jgi:nucleoside-diphosphate-sugar epimerase
MESRKLELFILGATGFIGREVVREAILQGHRVKALARTSEKAKDLAKAGAVIVEGNAEFPGEWIQEVKGADVLIDLVQPELPQRIGSGAIRTIVRQRLEMTRRLLSALQSIQVTIAPILISVSGIDDLAPDEGGRVSEQSPLRTELVGFAHIGVPVRRMIEASGTKSAFAYLGTVYGPGKTFARSVFPKLATGKFRMAGSGNNRMPLLHVEDAARALVHLAALGPERLTGSSFVVADGANATMSQFLGYAAKQMNAPPPAKAPLWLARLIAGRILCETLTRDVAADPASLRKTGFRFHYPSYREGLPSTLKQLGYDKRQITSSQRVLDKPGVFRTLSILALVFFIAANLALHQPQIRRLTGGLPILDMRLWYSEASAYKLLDVLGETGRSLYWKLLWSFDLLAPLLFGAFLSSAIRRTAFRRLNQLPFLASAFDYVENIAITFLLLRYPLRLSALVLLASTLTLLKWFLYAASVIVAVAGFVYTLCHGHLTRSFFRKRSRASVLSIHDS